MLIPDIGVLELIVRAAVVYFFLFFLLRFIGKKHVGQMIPFDLVVLLIISETVDASLIGDDKSLTGGLISAATLVVLVTLVGYATWRSKKLERWIEGRPKILVRHGHVRRHAERPANFALGVDGGLAARGLHRRDGSAFRHPRE